MPCYHPMIGYRSRVVNANGARPIVFNPSQGFSDMEVRLPCGQCIGCRLERSRQWAVRCVHEAQMHDDNCFITLTFDDENLNPNMSLDKTDFQKFMKRLRKYFSPKTVRYYHCGEYGEQYQRPHHHALLFGLDFSDKVLYKVEHEQRYYTSETLSRLWPFGWAVIGDVSFESAAYVARYCVNKITGDMANDYYRGRIPPYNTMSRRPGIGASWFAHFHSDVFPFDTVVCRNNVFCRPPHFYDGLYSEMNPAAMMSVKKSRSKLSRDHRHDIDGSVDRLIVREKVKKAQIGLCKRKVD